MNTIFATSVAAGCAAALCFTTACGPGSSNTAQPLAQVDARWNDSTSDAATSDAATWTSSDAGTRSPNDATPTPDATSTPDSGPDLSLPLPDTAPPNTGDCTYSDFYDGEKQFGSAQQGVVSYTSVTSSTEPYDLFSIEFYGAWGGATSAGTYSLDGINYADCGNCVLVRKNCTSQSCEKVFYADEGSLVVEDWEAGGNFSGYLDGVTAYEVTIDPNTYVSTRVPNGETWCLDGKTFNTSVPEGNPTSDTTEASCVEAGNGNLVGNNVANVSYTNCLGDTVNLHGGGCGGTSQALWIMATAGWCTACESFLAQLAGNHGGSLSREKIAQQTPGLDMLIVLGENQNGGPATASYCEAYAAKNNLDPAMLVLDHDTAGVQVPLISPAGYAVTIEGLANTWTAINPYLTADAYGGVASAYPWMAVLRASNMEYVWSDYFDGLGLDGAINQVLSGQ